MYDILAIRDAISKRWPGIDAGYKIVPSTAREVRFMQRADGATWPVVCPESVKGIPGVIGLGYCPEVNVVVVRVLSLE